MLLMNMKRCLYMLVFYLISHFGNRTPVSFPLVLSKILKFAALQSLLGICPSCSCICAGSIYSEMPSPLQLERRVKMPSFCCSRLWALGLDFNVLNTYVYVLNPLLISMQSCDASVLFRCALPLIFLEYLGVKIYIQAKIDNMKCRICCSMFLAL